MAIAFESGQATNFDFSAGPSTTFDAGTNADRCVLLLVWTDRGGATTITSATYNGVAMTAHTAGNHSSGYDYRLFYLGGASSGSNTVAAVLSDGNAKPKFVLASYSGVDGTTPVSGLVNASGFSSPPSWTVSSATGETVVCVAAQIGRTAVTATSPATERLDTQAGASGFYGFIFDEAGAASVTIDGTTTGGSAEWFGTALSLKAASGGAATSIALPRAFPMSILNH